MKFQFVMVLLLELSLQLCYGQSNCNDLLIFRRQYQIWDGHFNITVPYSEENNWIQVTVSYLPDDIASKRPKMLKNFESYDNFIIGENEKIPLKIRFTQESISLMRKIKKIELMSTIECKVICDSGEVTALDDKISFISLYPFGARSAKRRPCEQTIVTAHSLTTTSTTESPIILVPNTTLSPIDDFVIDPRYKFTTENPLNTIDSSICGKTDPSNLKSWPWLVALYCFQEDVFNFKSGATLLSENIILTTAHCLSERYHTYKANEILIIAGLSSLLYKYDITDNIGNAVESLYIHPDYKGKAGDFDADIALVILSTPLVFSPTIQPICMWYSLNNVHSLSGRVAKGFEWYIKGKEDDYYNTRELDSKVVQKNECVNSAMILQRINTDRIFCAGHENGISPCVGAGGGPLAIYDDNRWKLIGIPLFAVSTQWNRTCDSSQFVGYADISIYHNWIKQYLN